MSVWKGLQQGSLTACHCRQDPVGLWTRQRHPCLGPAKKERKHDDCSGRGGAFGTALAVALALDGKSVTLWARDPIAVKTMQDTALNSRLPDITLPTLISATNDLNDLFAADIILLATPAQSLRGFLTEHADHLAGKSLIACCKGIDLTTMTGPVDTIRKAVPSATAGILTGPSFAADIARGLPTALTLACADEDKCTNDRHDVLDRKSVV